MWDNEIKEPNVILLTIKTTFINFIMRIIWIIIFIILCTFGIYLWKHENLSTKIGVEVHKIITEVKK